jgi:hypothetical protein
MNNIFSDYPDIVGTFIIPMIIAIFAFAFPLLLQTISRIDDKYHSTKLVYTFRKDGICVWFLVSMVISIIASIVWLMQMPRLVDIEPLNQFIDNSALIFIGLSALSLIIATIAIIVLSYIYYVPEKLFSHMKNKYSKIKADKNSLYFEAISKLLFYSIQNTDKPLALETLYFYSDEFVKYRNDKEGQLIVYPSVYYDTVYEANELLFMRKTISVSYFNESALLGLFIDEYQKTLISNKTYEFLWRSLRQAIYYEREDFVMAYWRKAHQYFNFFLKPVERNYDSSWKLINEEDIAKREGERTKFLEFHYALGGLLMFLGKYELIKRIINWTNQIPPKYVLVPETMEEVIKKYMSVSTVSGYFNPVYYEQQYPFPDVSGVNADNIIQMWIKRYISILFLRQYTLHDYYTYSNSLRMPTPPEGLSEKKRWNEELNSLEHFTSEYLTNKVLLDKVGLIELADEKWFEENKKETPLKLINSLKSKIDQSVEKKKQEQVIDSTKLNDFKEKTKEIISQTFQDYSRLFNVQKIDANYKSLYFRGRYEVQHKAAFAKDQEMSYMNSDSIVAQAVSLEFKFSALNVFILMQNKCFLLKDEDIFKAIDSLKLDTDKFIILAIGLNIHQYSDILKVVGLKKDIENWFYNDIQIIEIGNYMNESVLGSFFIILKDDLPFIIHQEIPKSKVDKYKLERIDDINNTYAAILDFHNNDFDTISEEVTKSTGTQDLSKSVLVCVDINAEIRYKMSAKCIQLKAIQQHEVRDNSNNLLEVRSIWTSKSENKETKKIPKINYQKKKEVTQKHNKNLPTS